MQHATLLIEDFGARLRVENRLFLVSSGEEKTKLHPDQINIILMKTSSSVSTDAVLLAVEHDIPLLFLDKFDQVAAMTWSDRYGSISSIRKGQALYSAGEDSRGWIAEVVHAKIRGQVLYLRWMEKRRAAAVEVSKVLPQIERLLEAAAPFEGEKKQAFARRVLGVEGMASKLYFGALSSLLPKEWQFKGRSRRPAADEFNASLNYLYAILYGKVTTKIIVAGLDPFMGIYHADAHNRPALAFDMMEGYRVWADSVVVNAFSSGKMDESCFSTDSQGGGVSLTKRGKEILVPMLMEFLAERKDLNGRRLAREEHLLQSARVFAERMKNYSGTDNNDADGNLLDE